MLQVGTPPRSFPAAIDSGSGDLDIAALGCDGCVTAPPNNQYDHAASSTSKPAFPFVFHNTYETCDLKHPTKPCSIGGKLYTDVVSMGGLGPVPVKLGAIESQDTNFDQFAQIDGVVGFTSGGSEDVFSQLVAARACDNIWSICMHRGSNLKVERHPHPRRHRLSPVRRTNGLRARRRPGLSCGPGRHFHRRW